MYSLIVTIILAHTLSCGVYAAIPTATAQNEIINQHNRWRSSVEPPSNAMHQLVWDRSLAMAAQRTLLRCPLLSIVPGLHYATSLVKVNPGQNYFGILAKNRVDWTGVIKNWAIRARDTFGYGEGLPSPTNNDRQYAQLVWGRSQRVGCAFHRCGVWNVFACNYDTTPNGDISTPYIESDVQSCSGCADEDACVTRGPYIGRLLRKCEAYQEDAGEGSADAED